VGGALPRVTRVIYIGYNKVKSNGTPQVAFPRATPAIKSPKVYKTDGPGAKGGGTPNGRRTAKVVLDFSVDGVNLGKN